MRPSPMMSAPDATTIRGPNRSDRWPVTGPSIAQTSTVIENTAEVGLRGAPNSAAIGLKNAPKLYETPYAANIATNAAATILHARTESNWSSGGGGSAGAAVAVRGGSVMAFMFKSFSRHFQFLALRCVDFRITEAQFFQLVLDSRRDDQPRIPFVVGGHDVPWSMRRGVVPDHIFVSIHVVIPKSALADVGLREFPILLGLFEPLQEAFALFFFREVQIELANHDSVASQVAFVRVNFLETLFPDIFGHQRGRDMFTLEQLFVHSRDEDFFVVGAIENSDSSALRETLRGPPEKVMIELFC